MFSLSWFYVLLRGGDFPVKSSKWGFTRLVVGADFSTMRALDGANVLFKSTVNLSLNNSNVYICGQVFMFSPIIGWTQRSMHCRKCGLETDSVDYTFKKEQQTDVYAINSTELENWSRPFVINVSVHTSRTK